MRFDQPLARNNLRQHDLRGAAGDRVDGADREADDVQPRHRKPAQPPRKRHACDDHRQQRFAEDVHRQLAHAVEPDTRRQRKQYEWNDLHRRQQTHLRRCRVQQHGRGQRQREHRDLSAKRADQDRRPQAAIDGVAQQIVGREPEL